MRRLRVRFTKEEPVRYISHLDLMRTWQRILRRADIRVAHSQGFSPHARLVFAAPLAVGVTSECEIVDVFIEDDLDSDAFVERVTASLPPGICLLGVEEQPINAPAVMASVRSGEYQVTVETADDRDAAEAKIRLLLESPSLAFDRKRKDSTRKVDVRPAIMDIAVEDWADLKRVLLRLRMDQEGNGARPEEVLGLLDAQWHIVRIHRTGLTLQPELTELQTASAAGAAVPAIDALPAVIDALPDAIDVLPEAIHAD